jgi:hypothetical protein
MGRLFALVDTEELERGELPSDEGRAPTESRPEGDVTHRAAS